MRRHAKCAIALLLLGAFLNSGSATPVGQQPEQRTQVVLLGTGNPNADPERSGPSVAVVVNGNSYIVDCGPGVVRRAAAAARKGINALAVPNLSRLFLTHLHSDHTLGLPDIMLSPWTLDRTSPLDVYGPKGISAMTRNILEAYSEDIDLRRHGLEPSNDTGFRVNAHEIKPGVVYKDPNVTVRAFAVRHGDWKYAYGFRFETKDRTVVISGDTAPTPAVAENCNGCDVLVHEVYCEAGFLKRPAAWQKYHSNYHTSSRQLGEIAAKARPGLLILYHQLFWGASDEDLLGEVRRFYAGKVVSGRDLDVF